MSQILCAAREKILTGAVTDCDRGRRMVDGRGKDEVA